MPFDSNGLTYKTQQEILLELNAEVIQNVRTLSGDETLVVDTSEESPIGKLNNIYATHLASIWYQADQIQSAMRVDKTSGVSLEKLALLVGFIRTPSSYTQGDLRFVGEKGTIIPKDSIFANLQENQFTNDSDLYLDTEECYSFQVSVGVLLPSRDYSITINNIDFSHTSDESSTVESILTALRDSVLADGVVTASYIEDEDFPDESYLQLTLIDQSTTMSAQVSQVLTIASIEIEGLVRSVERGVIFGDANTVTTIITSQSGLDYIYNPSDFIIGGLKEEDEELASKVQSDFNTVGSSTPDTIEAVIGKKLNVRDVLVEENRLFEENSEGLPAKSYEVIVNFEGSNSEMAQYVWDTKPAGISTYGDVTETLKDVNGDDVDVHFSLAEDKFVYLKISGTSLDQAEGEVLPLDYKEIISQSVTVIGNNFEIHEDVIGKRFYDTIYSNVEGIDELEVLVYLSDDSNIDISTILEDDWEETWAIERKEIASFATNRFDISII